ncbi:MAG: hypothetical protein ACI9BF_000077 [Candidatus Paceibacteria bacterium]|jgi:hypothetical protein
MLFQVYFRKERTHWKKKDRIGSCVFYAEDHECARQIVTTVSMHMNRQILKKPRLRKREPRGVHLQCVNCLQRMIEGDFLYSEVAIDYCVPLVGFVNIRRALKMFYPLKLGIKGIVFV